MSDYLTITPSLRVAVDYDDDPTCPIQPGEGWSDYIGFINVIGRWNHNPPPSFAQEPITDDRWHVSTLELVVDRLRDHDLMHRGDLELDDLVQRYLSIFHPYVFAWYDYDLGGYWFVTRKSIDEMHLHQVPATEHEWRVLAHQAVRSQKAEYDKWAEGDIWQVALERHIVRVNTANPEDSREYWESVDDAHTSNIYFDRYYDSPAPAYNAWSVVADQFWHVLSKNEQEIVQARLVPTAEPVLV